MRQHSKPQGRQSKPMYVTCSRDLVELWVEKLAPPPPQMRKSYGLSNPLSKPRVLPRAYAPRGGLMTFTRPCRRARALERRAENH
jgi:hypothetical protein